MSTIHLTFKRLGEQATLPVASHQGDIGLDLSASEWGFIRPGETKPVSTGLALASCPLGTHRVAMHSLTEYSAYFLKIEGRSGLALKGIFPIGGIIDPEYRGEIMPIIHNSSDSTFYYNIGDRVAQLILYPAINKFKHSVIITETDHIEESSRGANGFGSTGI